MAGALLSRVDTRRVTAGELEHATRNQPIVHDHVRLLHEPQRAEREHVRISRSRADEIHLAGGAVSIAVIIERFCQ